MLMLLADCHTHSNFSSDGNNGIWEMVMSAKEKGVSILAITDHMEVDEARQKGILALLMDGRAQLLDLREAAEREGVTLLSGIELGQPLTDEPLAREALHYLKPDIVLCSLHSIPNHEDFYWTDYKKLTVSEIENMLEEYFKELIRTIAFGDFDVFTHLSYPFRYIADANRLGDIDPYRHDDAAEEALRLLIKEGKALENNASSFTRSQENYEINEHYLKLYYDLGGRLVTMASDAHSAATIGKAQTESIAMLKKIGFTDVVYFKERKPIAIKI